LIAAARLIEVAPDLFLPPGESSSGEGCKAVTDYAIKRPIPAQQEMP
jgi:hypothetical protein